MDSPSSISGPARDASAPKRRSKLRLVLVVAGGLLLALLLFLVFTSPSEQGVVWLTPAQLDQATKPRPLPRVRQLLRSWAGPVVRWFRGNPPNVRITYNSFALPPKALDPAGLGMPFATNAGGLRVWIASQTELSGVRSNLASLGKTSTGTVTPFVPMSASSVVVQSSHQAQMQMTQSVRVPGNSPPAGAPAASFVPVGTTIDLIPTAISGSIRMLMGVTSTEFANTSSAGDLAVNTNFFVACRVTVPQGGGLVIHSGRATNADGKTYWLIISPVLVDARGFPINR